MPDSYKNNIAICAAKVDAANFITGASALRNFQLDGLGAGTRPSPAFTNAVWSYSIYPTPLSFALLAG